MKQKQTAVGVDIGGTTVKLGLVNRSGRILFRESFLTRPGRGRTRLLADIERAIGACAAKARARGWSVGGVGIGAPGPVDVERGFVYYFPNIPGWKNTPLRKMLERRVGMAVQVDNDANVMALGELLFGAGRGASSLIALTLGTGVGGGMVFGGKLFHGHVYSAAEIGHIVVNEDGPLCACGSQGCLEAYVGSGYFVRRILERLQKGQKSVLRQWLKRPGTKLTPRLVAEAALTGDATALGAWEETAGHLGRALAGLVNVLNPERIVLGGGIAQSWTLLKKPLLRTLRRNAFPIAARSVRVVPAALGMDAGIIGAASLFLSTIPRK